jgi:protein gp37
VFVNSMSDLFHEAVPFEFVDKVFAVMALTPQHTYQILTKRPERMAEYMDRFYGEGGRLESIMENIRTSAGTVWDALSESFTEDEDERLSSVDVLENVQLGTSVENQETADERIQHLLKCSAAVRFLSVEPLLGDLNLDRWLWEPQEGGGFGNPFSHLNLEKSDRIHWVIVGGESGPKARGCSIEWIRSLVKQCREAGVAVFVKQVGANVRDRNDAGFMGDPGDAWDVEPLSQIEHNPDGVLEQYQGAPVRVLLNDPKGGEMSEWPEDLRVREMPGVRA